MEEFKDIKGYEGKYQVSNIGRVKSLKYGKEKIMKTIEDSKGYLTINLCKEGKMKIHKIHRLVAEAFIPNPNNYPIINHKDEKPSNNNVDNLEWCNQKYNLNYGTCQKRKVENIDWKKKVENTDYKELSRKRVSNTDYKAIAAKIDYKEVGRKNAEKLSKSVLQYTKDGKFVREWVSTNECGRNGFTQSAVSKCCRGITKSYKGFIWRYKNGEL